MRYTLLLLVCLLFVQQGSCVMGVDISQLFTTSTFECMKKDGYTFAIARGYCSYGGVDHNAVQSLTNPTCTCSPAEARTPPLKLMKW